LSRCWLTHCRPVASWCWDLDSSCAALILAVVLPAVRRRPDAFNRPGQHDGGRVWVVCILAGVARLGFVTELLSKPIRYGT